LDLRPGEDRAGGRTPARVANQGSEVADDQHRLVPEVLKLAQLHQRHGVPEMNVRGGRIHPELHAQRPTGLETREQLLLGKDARHAAPQRRELRRGRHAVTRSCTRRIAVARPVASSTSISAPCTSTGPDATSKRVGLWVRKRRRTCSIFTPRIEASGPHMPASVRYAVPAGRIDSSAVCTCVWLPMTADTLPSRKRPMATFSEVASPCMSTRITGVYRRSSATARLAARKGHSAGPVNTRPIRVNTPTHS